MKRLFSIFLFAALAASALAAPKKPGFAIVVDKTSYEKCAESIDAYATSVKEGGLAAFVCALNWETPEQVKDSLVKWYATRNIEGAVFVGDIPIPMIRQAQHMTSAFKMDENGSFEWRDCSVPSDRFYDDFDLKFDFLCRDEKEPAFFYYNLAADGAQTISCDIYTGRIKPSTAWGDKYEELDAYLRKLVRVKKEKGNVLDHVVSYTGEGSFSNSMVAWKDETKTLMEQVPQAFKSVDGARFFVFHQTPIMKHMLLDVAKLDEVDLYMFHCHGTPERQWIGGKITSSFFENDAPAQNWDEMYINTYKSEVEFAKYEARVNYRRQVRWAKGDKEVAAQKMCERYGIDSSWFEGAFDPEVMKADSLLDIETGIVLSDVYEANTNARVVLFDACYNGDFREDDFIANRYIMGSGNTVVGLGNSVNVLQDKAASPLLGMLTAGYSVGQWQQQVAILESHVIGDPTFKFAPESKLSLPELGNTSAKYWKKYLDEEKYPADICGLALAKIVACGDKDAAKILRDTYFKSKSYCLRYQAMSLILQYDSPYAKEVLLKALDDPYEFTRRKAAHFLTLRGEESTIDALVEALFKDYNAKRVEFNIAYGAGLFPDKKFATAFENKLASADFIFDKDEFAHEMRMDIESSCSLSDYCMEALTSKDGKLGYRQSVARGMRNEPYPYAAEGLIAVIKDTDDAVEMRVTCAEILGWFTYAYNRKDIIKQLQDALPAITDKAVANEVTKTIARLKASTK